MSVIIGIHGLSNKPEQNQLADWWQAAIQEGLLANRSIGTQVNFNSIYWADIMYPDGHDTDPEPYQPATEELRRYEDSWLDDMITGALDLGGDLLNSVKSFLDVRHTADAVIKRKLPDLHRYYSKERIRQELRGRLEQALLDNKSERTMLIAHSMGSIVAYDVLRALGRKDPNFRLRHFVTIGSPLGLPHVVYKIKQEHGRARTPSVVDRWTNFADRRDPVAFDVYLKGDYAANDRGVEVADDLVINDYPANPHKSYGYLRAPEMTDAIRAFL